MKLKESSITLLVGEKCTRIEIIDESSSTTFVCVELTPEQLSRVLSRQAHVKCETEVFGLDKVGKKMVHKQHEFDITGIDLQYDKRSSILSKEIQKTLPEGWVSDNYFGSQNSFFERNGIKYARTTIRQWVDIN